MLESREGRVGTVKMFNCLPGTRTKNLWCPAGIKLGILGHGLGVSGEPRSFTARPSQELSSLSMSS